MEKDYNNSVKTLEDVNRQRNLIFDENHKKDEEVKAIKLQLKDLEHKYYNEQALSTSLRERLEENEIEYETMSRRETANSEMAAIQIAALESKYLGMYKRLKTEEKQKKQFADSYQEEFTKHLHDEVELKKAEGTLKGQLHRNKELQNEMNNLNDKYTEAQRQLDLIKDEKIDLLAKVERKNNELDSTKSTLQNIETHNAAYIKKLREHAKVLTQNLKRMDDFKQMEIEDYSTRCLRFLQKVSGNHQPPNPRTCLINYRLVN